MFVLLKDLLQVVKGEPLHFDHFIVASSVIEWVASFREVVQDIPSIENGDPSTINPGYPQEVIC